MNEDDQAAVDIATASPGRRLGYSALGAVADGAFARGSSIVVRAGDVERELPRPDGLDGPRLQAVLGATTVAVARGRCRPASPGSACRSSATAVARRGDVELVDDGMAATPAKTAATLRSRPTERLVLVAGGS